MTKFSHSLDNFEPIVGQPPDSDLTRLQEAVAPLLLQILYGKTGVVHNLIGLIWTDPEYVARYGEAFPKQTRFGASKKIIDDDASAVVRARTELAHKSKRAEYATYEKAWRETTKIVFAVVGDTSVRELRDPKAIYTEVALKDLLSHLQAGCTGRHALDILALHNEMQRYHLKV